MLALHVDHSEGRSSWRGNRAESNARPRAVETFALQTSAEDAGASRTGKAVAGDRHAFGAGYKAVCWWTSPSPDDRRRKPIRPRKLKESNKDKRSGCRTRHDLRA